MLIITQLSLFVTEKCNLKCDYCFASNSVSGNINSDLAKRSIDFLIDHSQNNQHLQISFWGGEPLLQLDLIKELVDYAQEKCKLVNKEVTFSLPTNATLLTEKTIDDLISHNIAISLSLDGLEASQGGRLTKNNKNSFPLVEKAIKLIAQKYPVLPIIRKTVTVNNCNDLVKDILFFIQNGFRYISFNPDLESRWDKESLSNYKNQLFKLADYWIEYFNKEDILFFQLWDELIAIKHLDKENRLINRDHFFCGAGHNMIAVDINGDIYPCHRFVFYDREKRSECLGNIQENTINEDALKKYKQLNLNKKIQANADCETAKSSSNCFAFCPAINLHNNQDIYKTDHQTFNFIAINHQVINYIENKIGNTKAYKEYIKAAILRNEKYDINAPSNPEFWKNRNRTVSLSNILDKAESILNLD